MSGIERFGPFEYDRKRQELRKHGLRIRVPAQSLQILGALLDHPGEIVTREAIQELLWPNGTVVGFDQSINSAVKRLRTALGDSAETPRFLERVPRLGYRFIAPVALVGGNGPVPAAAGQMAAPQTPERIRHPWFRSRPIAGGAIAGAVVILLAAVWAWWWGRAPARQDLIVIGDFQNKTGNPIFNGALKQALISQMSQSRRVAIVPEQRIRTAIAHMRGAADELIIGERAREACQRVGAKAVLAGTIWMLGSRYIVGLDAIGCAGGEPLASENAEAESQERVLAALSDAAGRMRRRLGESLASVREMPAPAEATTTSLQALREYGLALSGKAKGDDVIALLEHTLQLDPEFASAWYTLSQAHFNRGEEMLCRRAAERAYALRERVSERERLLIENHYHAQVTGDEAEAIKAGELVARLYPYDGVARRAPFLPYCRAGEMERAVKLARQEVRLAPEDGVSYFNLAIVLLARSEWREAREVLEGAGKRGVDAPLFPFARYIAALLEGEPGVIAREEELVRKRPLDTRSWVLMAQALASRGRVTAALAMAPAPDTRAAAATAAAIISSTAAAEALFGGKQAARDARRALALDGGRRAATSAALALALSGSAPEAYALLGQLTATYPNDDQIYHVWVPAIRGAAALGSGDAMRALQEARRNTYPGDAHWACLVRGMANLRLGRANDAATEFEKILAARGALLTGSTFFGASSAYPAAQAGLARALALQGRTGESRKAYDALLSSWSGADESIPLLTEVRLERASLGGN